MMRSVTAALAAMAVLGSIGGVASQSLPTVTYKVLPLALAIEACGFAPWQGVTQARAGIGVGAALEIG